MSKRLDEWKNFSNIVGQHIENYTVAQYGDFPDDQVTNWTVEQCFDSISRYVNRRNSNRRGELESMRDMVKIAHFVCMAFNKRIAELDSKGKNEVATDAIIKIKGGTV